MATRYHTNWARRLVSLCILAGFSILVTACSDEGENPVTANAGDELTVMDFSNPFPLDPPPSGWVHRTFWTRPAMQVSLTPKDGIAALRCETNASGSIFGRYTDVSLTDYPVLAWDWNVEVPIESTIDERTKEGDDHPARLFVRFQDEKDNDHFVEIIWSNKKFSPGDYKYIDDFAHYVANGLDENVGRWHHEQIDLLGIYRTTTKLEDAPTVKLIAIFCDSDDTGGRSVAYFSNIRLRKTRSSKP